MLINVVYDNDDKRSKLISSLMKFIVLYSIGNNCFERYCCHSAKGKYISSSHLN